MFFQATSKAREADADISTSGESPARPDRSAAVRVGIIGLGYVGLPLARAV